MMNPGNSIQSIDTLFLIIIVVSIVMLVSITIAMIYFVFRYHKKRNPVATQIKDNWKLEVIWTAIPTIIMLLFFYLGWEGYLYIRNVPADALVVKVEGKMWEWDFIYKDGRKSKKELVIPFGKPIKLEIKSADVIHSVSIPAYRIKVDAVPNQTTHAWFQADKKGEYDLFCTEYCGTGHADMLAKVKIVSPEDYERWVANLPLPKVLKLSELGKIGETLLTKNRCFACHSRDGTRKQGSSYKGLWGMNRKVVRNGEEIDVKVDEDYVRRAIEQPGYEIVIGYNNIMKTYQFTDDEYQAIFTYLKELKDIE